MALRFLLSIAWEKGLSYILFRLLDPVLPVLFHRVTEGLPLKDPFELSIEKPRL